MESPCLTFINKVQRCSGKSRARDKNLSFVTATNLALINEEILSFCKGHEIINTCAINHDLSFELVTIKVYKHLVGGQSERKKGGVEDAILIIPSMIVFKKM